MRPMFIACLLLTLAGAQVDTAWVRTNRGTLGGAAATLVRVTPAGDIHVAGNTHGTQDSSDFLVLKYRADRASRNAGDIVLHSTDGRKVMDLAPGPNDISRLAPGVYFVHSTFDTRHSTMGTKVVVTR